MLAGAGELDGPGRVDLAEVRWRTRRSGRAGEAAMEALAALGDEAVALVIAAEAAAALGRPNEARRLAMRAMDCVGGPIDGIFAGMPRSAVWPADAAEPPPTAATLFQQDSIPAQARRAGDSEALVASTLRSPAAELPAAGTTVADTGHAGLLGRRRRQANRSAPELPDPAEELDAAARALVAGSLDEAALRFAADPAARPRARPGRPRGDRGRRRRARRPASVVRGDAFRLVGLETEARRAYAMAAWSGARDRRGTAAAEPDPVPDRQPDAAPDPPPVSDTIPRVQRTRTQGRHARH